MTKTTICLIDDHKLVRQGLKELLEKLGNYKVIHEFESGEDFLKALPLPEKPDICILDYSMPNFNGIQVLKSLLKLKSDYKILLLTQHFDEQIIDDAYNFGARGFLNKNCTAQDLKFAIDNIVTSGYYNITEILKRLRNTDTTLEEIELNCEYNLKLSIREHEFLTFVCNEQEFTYDEIANIMEISVKSVEGLRAALFERFKIKSKVGLVLFSFKNRLTEPFL